MAAPTIVWDENNPPDVGRSPSLGAQDIRINVKQATRERLVNAGMYVNLVALDTDEGKLCCGEAGTAGEFVVYESDDHATNRTTPAMTLGDGAHASLADTFQLGDGVGGSRPYTLKVQTANFQDVTVSNDISVSGKTTVDELQVSVRNETTGTYAPGEETFFVADTTGGTITINLPDLTASLDGRVYIVKRFTSGINDVTINSHATDAIGGGTNTTLTLNDDGTDKRPGVILIGNKNDDRWEIVATWDEGGIVISA